MVSRRQFLTAMSASVLTATVARRVVGQEASAIPGATMEGDGYIPVRRPSKESISRRLTKDETDRVEHLLSCPCPCTLDVYTCRTSMPCGFSPRMHADVLALADGGYTADEIIAAFKDAYGEKVLMAPEKRGFNLVGWFAPFVALGTGGVVLVTLLRKWGQRSAQRASVQPPRADVDATPEELARLQEALRDDHR